MKKILTLLLMMLTISLTVIPVSFAADDNSLYRDNSSSMFAPGYLNAAKYQAEAIIHQQTPRKSLAENIIEFVMGKTEAKIEKTQAETAQTKPKLQQKQSSANSAQKASAAIAANAGNVKIGTGAQEKDASGKVIAEVIDGQRYVYAGFDNVGKATIADAIAAANAGDKVIVKAGTYDGAIAVKNGVGLFGGYNDSGIRDIQNNLTTITGMIIISNVDKPTEINGFTINLPAYYSYIVIILNSCNVELINNTFKAYYGISVQQSSVVVRNNNFNNSYGLTVSSWAEHPSNVTSINNNFNGYYGMALGMAVQLGGVANISSTGDYFSNMQTDNYADMTGIKMGGFTISFNGHPDEYIVWAGGGLNRVTTSFNETRAQLNTVLYRAPLNSEIAAKTTSLVNTAPALDEYNSFQPFSNENNYNAPDPNKIGSILRTLLSSKDGLKYSGVAAGPMDIALTTRMMENNLRSDAIATPINQNVKEQEMGIAQSLANILKNPTEDQKVMLDVIKALLADTSKLQDNEGKQTNPDLRKAENDLLNAVANILLAQAVPGLLKSGEMSNIKAMFSEFDQTRAKIMLDYTQSTRPYYENTIKDLVNNMAMLQAKSMLNPDMTKEELSNLPPSELDKILEKMRRMKDKTFEEEYILQQEAKYRKAYIDPNKKKLEDEMRGMLKTFTGRINDVLKSSDKK